MKTSARFLLLSMLLVFLPFPVSADSVPLRFVWLNDPLVGSPSGEADLRLEVHDINSLTGYSFVIMSGNVTTFGSREQLILARSILDGLQLPCHVIPGDHDCNSSESGATEFGRIWGSDRFAFDAGGCCFIGLTEGPVMRKGDGHFAPQDVRWLKATLAGLPREQPILFVSNYPLNDRIDNWFTVLEELKKFNTQAILSGQGRRDESTNFDGIPAIVGAPTGYSLVEIDNGVLTITGRDRASIPLQKHNYAATINHWPRQDFSINSKYPDVIEKWRFDTKWTMSSSPAFASGRVFAGDASGKMRALSLKTGALDWEFNTGGPIYSSPAVSGHRIVFASVDGGIYEIGAHGGRKLWRFETGKPVVASPVIFSNVVYIGASDGKFRALGLYDGKLKWEFPGVGGFVRTRPLYCNGRVIFGAWDGFLYALNSTNGQLLWKWKDKIPGEPGVMFSPAALWSAASGRKLFAAAPERLMTLLDFATGDEIWRAESWQVGHSVGLSGDGSRFYAQSADTGVILGFAAASEPPEKIWELDTHSDNDLNSAMLVEKQGVVYYGTKNGLLLAIDPRSGTLLWEHKLGVTALNTVVPLEEPNEVLVSDADGKITRVGPRQH